MPVYKKYNINRTFIIKYNGKGKNINKDDFK